MSAGRFPDPTKGRLRFAATPGDGPIPPLAESKGLVYRNLGGEFAKKFRKATDKDTLSNPPHDVKVVAQVVDCRQGAEQHLARHEEMAEVGSGKVAARITAASGIHREWIFAEARLFDDNAALRRKQAAVAGVAGGHHAIHHVHATGDILWQFFREADSHYVARLAGREPRRAQAGHRHAEFARLPDREAPDGIAFGIERR